MQIAVEKALEAVEQTVEPRQLTKIQRLVFKYVWQGLSYSEIARETDYDVGYLRDTGSKLWQILSDRLGTKVTKQNLQSVLKHYFRQHSETFAISPFISLAKKVNSSQDWGEAINTAIFYGRTSEMTILSQWIVEDQCRLIAILGMGGIGKTTLSVKLAEQIQGMFKFVFWRSLRDAPPFDQLLTSLLRFLIKENSPLAETTSDKLNQLLDCLRSARCLIVLDNFDALFTSVEQVGVYRQSYEDYEKLVQQVSEWHHQSCLLITSRETPAEITRLQGKSLPIREWRLQGLEVSDASQLLKDKGLEGSSDALNHLIQCYRGNPLALKIAASSIHSLFAGSISDFLQQGVIVFNGIRHLLQSQIKRLSDLEQQVMYWLAINREPLSLNELQADLILSHVTSGLLESLESLRERSLLERTAEGFTQQPVVMEYMTEQLIAQVVSELNQPSPSPSSYLIRYALLKATTRDYIRLRQTCVIVEPVVSRAIAVLGNKQGLIESLSQLLKQISADKLTNYGYTVGNILNLFNFLQVDLTEFDFSGLSVWQAYLAEVKLQRVNFSLTEFSRCVFAETFGGISCVAFSPDGKQLATSDTSGNIQIWDLVNGQKLNTFKSDLVWTWTVAFSPDGQWLASGGDDHLVKLWNPHTGECIRLLKGHTHTVNALAFHPEGNLLASCSLDGTIRLWPMMRMGENSAETLLEGHQGRVWSLDFSPDGAILVSGSEDKTLKLWDVNTLSCRQTLGEHTHWIKSVAFSPDGQMIASASFNGIIKLWSVSTGECLKTWQGHLNPVTTVVFSPNSRFLASASYDQTVKIWEVTSTQCLKTLTQHNNRVWSVAFSPDGQFLASGGDDHATCLWHWETGQCTKVWTGYSNRVLGLTFNLDKRWLVTGHEDQTIRLWHLSTGQVQNVLYGHKNLVWSVAIEPQRGILASGSGDRTIKLWQIESGVCLTTLMGHLSWVWSVNFSPEGDQLVSGSYDQTIKLWDVVSGECLKTLEGHTAPVVCLIFSPDGQFLVSSSLDQMIKLWDLQTGRCVKTLLGHQNSVWTVAFSPEGNSLASGSYDRTVKIWDVSTGNCLLTFEGHAAPIMSLAFSPNGERLITGSSDQTLKVWDSHTGSCLRTLYGHKGSVSALVWPSGDSGSEIFVSGSFDETVRFWDSQTGECVRIFRTPRPYDGMNITGAAGLTEAQKITLKALGAVEHR